MAAFRPAQVAVFPRLCGSNQIGKFTDSSIILSFLPTSFLVRISTRRGISAIREIACKGSCPNGDYTKVEVVADAVCLRTVRDYRVQGFVQDIGQESGLGLVS
jgi:hypothetical protein